MSQRPLSSTDLIRRFYERPFIAPVYVFRVCASAGSYALLELKKSHIDFIYRPLGSLVGLPVPVLRGILFGFENSSNVSMYIDPFVSGANYAGENETPRS